MTVFNEYARYYDLLYQDKDYWAETAFVDILLQKYKPAASDILDLGCGTGRHAEYLSELGYRVEGVDSSPDMLVLATERLTKLRPEVASRLRFSQGDVRNVRLPQTFHAVLSLFHVISYQVNNKDLAAAFATAAAHLEPGGFFLFDCWYGPAVLAERPEKRVKSFADDMIEVLRKATPEMCVNDCTVAVNYDIEIANRSTGGVNRIQECHRMRYLFLPEIDFLLDHCDMKRVYFAEWMTGEPPGMNSWNVCVGAVKKKAS